MKVPSKSPSIWIVDDQDQLRKILTVILTWEGYRVECLEDGMALLEALQKSEADQLPDLLILDQHMPRLSGTSALKAMEAKPAWASIPVIMLTASDIGTLAWRDSTTLRKPVDRDQLLTAIKAFFQS